MYGESYKSEIRTLSTAASFSMLSMVGEYVSLAILLIVDFEIPVMEASCRADTFLLYIMSANNIGVKKYDGNENVKSYKFYSRMKNGWVRIGCKEFIKYLSSLTGLEFSPAIRYIAKYDEQEEILYISVLDALQSQKDEEVDEDK